MSQGKRRKASRARRGRGAAPAAKPARRARSRGRLYLAAVGAVLAALAAFSVVFFVGWVSAAHRGQGDAVEVTWPADAREGARMLAAGGVIDRPSLFRVLLGITSPFVTPIPGPHLFTDQLTPAEVLRRLARLTSRQRARVLVPEGFNRFQIGERLEQLRVCSRSVWAVATRDRTLLARLGVPGDSPEGYLFPATYDLFLDSAAESVVTQLVTEGKKRLAVVRASRADAFTRLEERYGWGEREILTLASVVEKEAARADELPVIASVFLNRLSDTDFRPARSLQSDPTAMYGCLIQPELASCQGAGGHATPDMLRDASNVYNTYRHAGLPPGPIANPGLSAVLAVLSPAETDFLFFVARGDGRHTFSRTLEEHENAIRRPR